MKLAEITARLEEIKQRGYENENFCSCGNHVPFLLTHLEASLAREEKLVEALDKLKYIFDENECAFDPEAADMSIHEALTAHKKSLEEL